MHKKINQKNNKKSINKSNTQSEEKKATNSFNRRTEWIKEGENQMIESLVTLFKRIREEGKVCNQWKKINK